MVFKSDNDNNKYCLIIYLKLTMTFLGPYEICFIFSQIPFSVLFSGFSLII